MTKTLTEQWREGTLDERIRYYFRFPKGRVLVRSIHSVNNMKKMESWDKIECLDAVPLYEDYLKLLNESYKLKLLEKKLNIATKALKEYADKDKWHYCSEDIEYFYTTKDGWYDAVQALKEMEDVK